MIRNASWHSNWIALAVALSFSSAAEPSAAEPWPAGAVMPAKTLARRLGTPDKPLVIQIGYELLYGEGHVPGALHAGPAEEPKGLAAVKKLVGGLPRDREIVLYCGCCPFKECANLIPAYKLMRQMGFKKLRILALPDDFQLDWKLAGLPTETGTASAAPRKR